MTVRWNQWSLYRITFRVDTYMTIEVVAPGITVAMTQAVDIANGEADVVHHLADITRVEEVSRSVWVADPKGGRDGREPVDRVVAAVPSQPEEESGGLQDLVREHP